MSMKDLLNKMSQLEALSAPKTRQVLNESSPTPVATKLKRSLKDVFNELHESIPPGAKPLPVMDPTNKQAGMGFVTSSNPAVQNILKHLDPKDVQIVQAPGQTQGQQPAPTAAGQPAPGGATGQPQAGQMQMKENESDGYQTGVRAFKDGLPRDYNPYVDDPEMWDSPEAEAWEQGWDDAADGVVKEEQLDELSKETLGNYIKKNRSSVNKIRNKQMGVLSGDEPLTNSDYDRVKDSPEWKDLERQEMNRDAGRKLASAKIRAPRVPATEDEQLDELSRKTLGSYIAKNKKSAAGINSDLKNMYRNAISQGTSGTELLNDPEWQELENKSAKRDAGKNLAIAKMRPPAVRVHATGEQLDELSNELLDRYDTKANRNLDNMVKNVQQHAWGRETPKGREKAFDKAADELKTKGSRRVKGIELARSKYFNDKGVEVPGTGPQLDEISQRKLNAYYKKAGDDARWNDSVRNALYPDEYDPDEKTYLDRKIADREKSLRLAGDKLHGRAKVNAKGVRPAVPKDPNFDPWKGRNVPANRVKFDSNGNQIVDEGAKVDRMVKHIEKSERDSGKSKEKASDIAWATANKRGMLDNKNKKKTNETTETEYRVLGTYDAKTSKGYDTRPVSVKVKAASEKEAKELATKKLASHKNYKPTRVEVLSKKMAEADIPSTQGIDTMGAGLGAGRSATTLESKSISAAAKKSEAQRQSLIKKAARELNFKTKPTTAEKLVKKYDLFASDAAAITKMAKELSNVQEGKKPDFLDLDKDGTKKETMKKAAADKKKQKVKESMNHRISAARLEGKTHGLRGHAHHGKAYEDLDEMRAYHEGYKAGLDELYEMGMYETVPATVPGMARNSLNTPLDEMYDDMDEMFSYKPNKSNPRDVLGLREPGGIGRDPEGYKAMKRGEPGYPNYPIGGPQGYLPEDDMEEGALGEMDKTAYMKQQAIKTPGNTFKAFGQTMHDRDVLEGDFAFEAWDRQLNSLINEGLSVSISKGQQNSPDSVTITAQDQEAEHLLAFVKNAGLGLFGDDKADMHSSAMSIPSNQGAPGEVGASDMNIDVVDGHDGMLGLMQKLSGINASGSEDYADEEDDESQEYLYGNEDEEPCNECGGMMEQNHSCRGKMDEVETPDQMEFKVAEDNAPDTGASNSTNDEKGNAAANQALATADAKQNADDEQINVSEEDEEDVNESFYNLLKKFDTLAESKDEDDEDEDEDEDSHKLLGAAGKAKKSFGKEQVDEWANNAGPGKTVSDTTFEQDIEFMTKVISGGLNKPKSTGQTTVPVVASQLDRLTSHNTTGINESVSDWKKLAGIK